MREQIEGKNAIKEAIEAGVTINKILVVRGSLRGSAAEICNLARKKGIFVAEVDKRKLDTLARSHAHQGMIAEVSSKEYVEVEDILNVAEEKGEPVFIVLLDEITDPHNFGSILRSADAAGVHGVIIPKNRSVRFNATVGKTSAGAMWHVPVAQVTNLARTIDELKERNVWVAGADMEGENVYGGIDLKGHLALIIGSEGKGLRRLVKEKCDFLVSLPMRGKISSLNASVAAALLMFEVVRQRGEKTAEVDLKEE
jgi:23S rRNA (guanosine2251-2'-O)-methyltransferase